MAQSGPRVASSWDAFALAYHECAPGERFNRLHLGAVLKDGDAIMHPQNDFIRIIAVGERVDKQAITGGILDYLEMIFRRIEFEKGCDSDFSRFAELWRGDLGGIYRLLIKSATQQLSRLQIRLPD